MIAPVVASNINPAVELNVPPVPVKVTTCSVVNVVQNGVPT